MLERERSELRVGHHVAGDPVSLHELAEQPRVLASGLRNPGGRGGEPVGDALPGDRRLERARKRA